NYCVALLSGTLIVSFIGGSQIEFYNVSYFHLAPELSATVVRTRLNEPDSCNRALYAAAASIDRANPKTRGPHEDMDTPRSPASSNNERHLCNSGPRKRISFRLKPIHRNSSRTEQNVSKSALATAGKIPSNTSRHAWSVSASVT